MAVATNTIQAVGRVGIREDLSDKIYQLFPDDCPFQAAIGSESASQVLHEWQTDVLVAPNANNAQIQGADLTNDARPPTVRQGNYTQIMTKVVGSSTTMEATKAAGRASELGRELMKAGRELKTDAETRFCGNYAAVAPTSSVAGQSAGALAFIVTNNDMGATATAPVYNGSGTSGVPTTAAVNGTLRTYAESNLANALANCWTKGGNPKFALSSMTLKRKAAAFPGLVSQRREAGTKLVTIVSGAEVYTGDGGTVNLVPSRFMNARDTLVVDPEYWAIADLDPLKVTDLAKTGLATRKALYQESTLVCRNEAASAAIRDLQ